MSLRGWWARVRATGRRDEIAADLREEIGSHLELQDEDERESGIPLYAAYASARVKTCNASLLIEDSRAAWGFPLIESLFQDVRYALRLLRKSPGFAAVATLTLALGIGANTAIFSIVNTAILRPLPYKDSSRLALVQTSTAMFPGFHLGLSWIALQQIRSDAPAFEQFSVYTASQRTLTGGDHPDRVSVTQISDGFFEELGIAPQLGRLFVDQDRDSAQGPVVILSDAAWRTRFGASPFVIGCTVMLDRQSYTIVGVAARGFAFPRKVDFWTPLTLTAADKTNPTSFYLTGLAKLRNGTTLVEARTQLKIIADRIAAQNPPLKAGYSLIATQLLEDRIGDVKPAFLMLLGGATFVLLIACANLASLILGRAWYRQRELGLRAALGASRVRLFRQTLVESCTIGVAGGLAGALLAVGGVSMFRAIAPSNTPRLDELHADPILLWFSIATSLACGILFGILPARRAMRLDPDQTLKDAAASGLTGTGSMRQPKLGSALVVVEVALAFVLATGAALVTNSLRHLLRVNTGIRTENVLTLQLPQTNMPRPEDLALSGMNGSKGDASAKATAATAEQAGRLQGVMQAIGALPGVEGVAASDHGVLNQNISMISGMVAEDHENNPDAPKMMYFRYVSPNFFDLMGVPLLRGRSFTSQDGPGAHGVAIVNESLARKLWGTVDVVGQHIGMLHSAKMDPNDWIDVVGVVADTREVELSAAPQPECFMPIFQSRVEAYQLVVRTAGDPAALSGEVMRKIWSVSPDQAIVRVNSIAYDVAESLGEPRMQVALLGTFAGIGLTLALLGVYGVLAYSVARRTREIGIRMALGARPRNVLRMIVRQGLVLAAAGVSIGIGAALALHKVIADELFEVKPNDPATFIAMAALLLAVACVACAVPALCAMRTDPTIALRHE